VERVELIQLVLFGSVVLSTLVTGFGVRAHRRRVDAVVRQLVDAAAKGERPSETTMRAAGKVIEHPERLYEQVRLAEAERGDGAATSGQLHWRPNAPSRHMRVLYIVIAISLAVALGFDLADAVMEYRNTGQVRWVRVILDLQPIVLVVFLAVIGNVGLRGGSRR